MYKETLALAREDWASDGHFPSVTIADNLIALAVNCIGQTRYPSAPLTDEDVAIILRVAPAGLRIENGSYVAFGNCQDSALRFVLSLNR